MESVCINCDAWSQFMVAVHFCIAMGASAVAILTVGFVLKTCVMGFGWIFRGRV